MLCPFQTKTYIRETPLQCNNKKETGNTEFIPCLEEKCPAYECWYDGFDKIERCKRFDLKGE